MCGCGRTRNQQVTSVQAAQDAQDLVRRMEEQAVREAETYTQSAVNAINNSSSN
jgi:hypothetical protein